MFQLTASVEWELVMVMTSPFGELGVSFRGVLEGFLIFTITSPHSCTRGKCGYRYWRLEFGQACLQSSYGV